MTTEAKTCNTCLEKKKKKQFLYLVSATSICLMQSEFLHQAELAVETLADGTEFGFIITQCQRFGS